ncbi:MAG: hypothetical protein RRY95_08690 [Oscillospiraceae bacterium]
MTQTTFYQLNQWSPEDRIMRIDFNDDNGKIDAALHTNADAIAAERRYCDNRVSSVSSAVNSHTHWTKISDQTLPAASDSSFTVSVPPLGSYYMVRMEVDLSGAGTFSFKPSNADSVHTTPIGQVGQGNGAQLGYVNAEGKNQIIMFPGGNSATKVSTLVIGAYDMNVGAAQGAFDYGQFHDLVFSATNGAIHPGGHFCVYAMR